MRSSLYKKHKKWILVILALVILGLGANYLFIKYRIQTQSSVDTQKAAKEMKIQDIHKKQKNILDFYTSQPLSNQTKVMVFYELMEPLGGLDPIAKPEEIKDIHATVNFLFGLYYENFGFSEPAGYAATAPIRHKADFEEVTFFKENKQTLELLVDSIEYDNLLSVLSWGYSTNYRINEYFGDDIRNFYWKINTDNSPFYSPEIIKSDSEEYQTLVSLKKDYGTLIDKMAEMKIQSIYKCDDKVIVIVDGVADNAFGYIYNAQTGSDVNCGVLKGRFRIDKYIDKPITDKWRFWFAK